MVAKEKTTMTENYLLEDGVEVISYEIEVLMDDLDAKTRTWEEFPLDEQVNIELEMSQAKIDSVLGAGEEMIANKDFGLKDEPVIREQIQYARERRSYNRMWGEAYQLFRQAEWDELRLKWQIIRENFEEKERKYNEAV